MPRHTKSKTGRKTHRKRKTTHRVGRFSVPQMPKKYRVKLVWSDDLTITSLSSWRFGLAQFWNQIPGYYAEYMKIYKMSRILSLSVRCTVINQTASTPAELVSCVLPFSDYSKTLAQVKQLPGAKQRFISGGGGLDRGSVSHSADLNSWLGINSTSIRDYQQSASEAASTLALLPDTPVLAIYAGGASTEPTLRVFLKVTYSVEFFEPEYPGSVAFKGKKPIDMTEIKEILHEESSNGTTSDYQEDNDDYDCGTQSKEKPVAIRKSPHFVYAIDEGTSEESGPSKGETRPRQGRHLLPTQQLGELDTPAISRPSSIGSRSKRDPPRRPRSPAVPPTKSSSASQQDPRASLKRSCTPKVSVIDTNFPLASSSDKQRK